MAVNVHAPYPRPRAGSGQRAGSRPGLQSRVQAGRQPVQPLQPRGLAVWLQPCEGQEIDAAVWAEAAKAVLAHARRLAPEAEVLVWSDAENGASAGGPGPSGVERPDASKAVEPPVPLAGRRSTVAVDLAAGTVLLDGAPVSFTAMEYSLLRYLVENQSRPVQRQELQGFLESLDCPGAAFRSIDVYVGRVRRKLGSARHAIATVRGGGYQFVPGPGSTVRGPAEYCI